MWGRALDWLRLHYAAPTMSNASSKPSPAFNFITAASNAISKSVGDGLISATMKDVVRIAITTKMKFDADDGGRFVAAQLSIRTCVGCFDPLDRHHYDAACIAGGTYAKMWERWANVKPFMAPALWTDQGQLLRSNRVAPGVAIVIPAKIDATETLEHTREGEVWWVSTVDFDKDRIILVRYDGKGLREPHRNYGRKSPAKRQILSRSEWNQLCSTLHVPGKKAA